MQKLLQVKCVTLHIEISEILEIKCHNKMTMKTFKMYFLINRYLSLDFFVFFFSIVRLLLTAIEIV